LSEKGKRLKGKTKEVAGRVKGREGNGGRFGGKD
jgi:hypothetical protein